MTFDPTGRLKLNPTGWSVWKREDTTSPNGWRCIYTGREWDSRQRFFTEWEVMEKGAVRLMSNAGRVVAQAAEPGLRVT